MTKITLDYPKTLDKQYLCRYYYCSRTDEVAVRGFFETDLVRLSDGVKVECDLYEPLPSGTIITIVVE